MWGMGGFRNIIDWLAYSVGLKPRPTAPTTGASGSGMAVVWFDSDDSKLKYTYGGTDSIIQTGTGTPAVELQGSTPGTAQTGNSNISGTAIAGTVVAGATDANVKSYKIDASYVAVEADGTSADVGMLIMSQANGVVGIRSTTKGDPTGLFLFYPETSPTQSAFATNGTAGMKISNTTASGPIDIGHPGSGADNGRWGVRFKPDSSGGPQLLAQGGPGSPANGDLILSALGSGSVKVRNSANSADAALTSGALTTGGNTSLAGTMYLDYNNGMTTLWNAGHIRWSDSGSIVGTPIAGIGRNTGANYTLKVTDGTTGYGYLEMQGLVLPKTSGYGIKVEPAAPTFAWVDLIGAVSPKASGAGSPTRATFRGNVKGYKFIANDECDFTFHIPHDWVPGHDCHWHIHWSHTGTAITGNLEVTTYATYASRAGVFPAEIVPVITYNTTDIATTPQYAHMVTEIQLSAASPSATQFDSDSIEVDGIINMTMKVTGLPTITGGDLFIWTGDIHYQTTGIGTKNKSPNFYA